MNNHKAPITPHLKVGTITIGTTEANNRPFENNIADFEHINDHLRKNPAYKKHIIPDALVSSCSECCMTEINGKPNILGLLFRKSRKGKDCRNCPVSNASAHLPARDAVGNLIQNHQEKILSESDIVQIAENNEA